MSEPGFAFYGDDFTGSADAMEVLQWAGLRTVLFLKPPTASQLSRFENLRAFGVAGWSRTMSPQEMEQHLRPALEAIAASGANIVHYKTCSTFDSSPEIGSIGKAIELGREVFGGTPIPMIVGAPNLGRYQVFGNLFARSGLDSEPYRLDRHPTMRHHPITPMNEADLRQHLAAQTDERIDLCDVLHLEQDESPCAVAARIDQEAAAVLFDVLYPDHLPRIGGIMQAMVEERDARFFVGSSGVEYALTSHWSQSGQLQTLRSHAAAHPTFGATEQLLAITGSCSPVNDRQVGWATEHGFEEVVIDTPHLVDDRDCRIEIESVVDKALHRLRSGANVILHSSRGPNDSRVDATKAAMTQQGFQPQDIKLRSGRILGPRLGQILKRLLEQHPLTRVGVAGGDTSGYVAAELGITALEAIAPVAPGSPLCRASADNALDGVEFFFKGGQVGRDDVWGTMLHGTQNQ